MPVHALVALAAALQGASAATPAEVHLVERLYAREALPPKMGLLFAHDLAAAYRKDTGVPGEVGVIDFDWRYGAQDFQITGLKVEAAPLAPGQAPMTDVGLVRARFKNFGKPGEVFYRLCLRPGVGWRIADVYSKDASDPWDLRDMLKLDPDKVRC